MVDRHNPKWLTERVSNAGFFAAFALCDPNEPDFSSSIHEVLEQAAGRLWRDLEKAFDSDEPEIIVRNAWSISENRTVLAALVRSALHGAGNDARVGGILKSIRDELGVLDGDWVSIIAGGRVTELSKLVFQGPFTDALQYRYSIASLSATELNAAPCLSKWLDYPHCSRMAGQRELRRAVASAMRHERPIRRLRVREIRRLPLKARLLLATDVELLEKLIAAPKHRARIALEVTDAWEVRNATKEVLLELAHAIQHRKVAPAHKCARSIRPRDVTQELATTVKQAFETALLRPGPSLGQGWTPFSNETVRLVRTIRGAHEVPAYFGMSTTEILGSLAAGRTNESLIPLDDRERIGYAIPSLRGLDIRLLGQISRSSRTAKSRLLGQALQVAISENQYTSAVVSLLGKSRCAPLRTLIRDRLDCGDSDWITACAGLFGSPAGKGLFPAHSSDFAWGMLAMVGEDSISNASFLEELGRYIARGERKQPWDFDEVADEFRRRTSTAAEPSTGAAGATSSDELEDEPFPEAGTAPDAKADLGPEKVLPPELEELSCRDLLRRVKAEPDVLPQLRARRGQLLPEPTSLSGIQARILWIRHRPDELKLLAKAIGAEAMEEALRALAKRLPKSSRDRGYFELAAELGPRWIKPLAKVMAMGDRSAGPGCKLDGAYRQYSLPKKSGGNRTISVPSPVLKSIQRRILNTVFASLQRHEAAFGFTPGRSIVENAAIHVGQQVVVNCDVQDCFPSVRWPLVLGVIRKDLANRLSPAAISILVDVCTMKGALPIGAPTSPALLNRVFVRSDEEISRAAEARDCRFSRYADDLTFSGDGRAVELLGIARRTLSQIGLRLDDKKTNIYRKGRRQIVTGLAVNERVSVPRRLRRRMRAAVHAVEHGDAPTWHGKEETIAALRGRLQFTRNVNEIEAEALLARLDSAIDYAAGETDDELFEVEDGDE